MSWSDHTLLHCTSWSPVLNNLSRSALGQTVASLLQSYLCSSLPLLIAPSAHRSPCPSLPLPIIAPSKSPLPPNLLCPLPPPHLLTAPLLCPPCPSQPLCQPHRPAPAPLCPPYCLLTCTLTHSLPLLLRKIGTVVVWAISGISVFVFYRLVQKKYPLFKFPSFLIPTNLGNLGQPMHSQWA